MVNDPEIVHKFKTHSDAFHARMDAMPRREDVVSYSNRFVVFLDILGFREILAEHAANSPHELFHNIVDSHWFQSATSTVDIQLLSDSVIITSRDEEAASFLSVANTANNLRNSFLERGLLLRGAIAFGRHFQSHGILLSPALVEAFDLERQSAKYPRIVCSQSVLDHVLPTVRKNQKGRLGIVGPFGFHVIRDQLPSADFDGLMVVEFLPDTLEAYFLRTGHHHDSSYIPSQDQLKHFREVGPQLLMRWRSGIEKARLRCKNTAHKQKVGYLIGKWNDYIKSFKELPREGTDAYLL